MHRLNVNNLASHVHTQTHCKPKQCSHCHCVIIANIDITLSQPNRHQRLSHMMRSSPRYWLRAETQHS